jgi:hypothetical protein
LIGEDHEVGKETSIEIAAITNLIKEMEVLDISLDILHQKEFRRQVAASHATERTSVER